MASARRRADAPSCTWHLTRPTRGRDTTRDALLFAFATADSMADQLTEGVIAHMLDSTDGTTPKTPVCQVLSLKKLQTANASASDRYRVVLSDGVYYTQGSCV